MGSSARKKFENLLILLAATFLLNILVGVPLVLVIYLLGIKGSGSGDTVQVSNFQAASPDQVQVLPTFLEAIDQLGLKPFNFSYTGIFNVLGNPVTQVPLGLGNCGVPLGIQVVAGRNHDRLTLAVAQELENLFGGWVPPSV